MVGVSCLFYTCKTFRATLSTIICTKCCEKNYIYTKINNVIHISCRIFWKRELCLAVNSKLQRWDLNGPHPVVSHPIEMALEECVQFRSDGGVVKAFLKELHEKI